MFFSVIVPLYNKEKYVEKAVSSALKQSFKDIEVIVIDDGSVDNSLSVVKTIQDSRLRVIEQKNMGVSMARNVGIKESHGDFIAFLDADDEWDNNHLESILYLIKKYKDSDIFVTSYKVKYKNKLVDSFWEEEAFDNQISYWDSVNSKYETVWTSATVVRANLVKSKEIFFKKNEFIGQDLAFFSSIAQHNPRVAFINSKSVTYNRLAENNARTRVKIAYPKEYLGILKNEYSNSERTNSEKISIQNKHDRKIIAYAFTLFLSKDKKQGMKALKLFIVKHYFVYVLFLVLAVFPNFLIKFIYKIRLKIF